MQKPTTKKALIQSALGDPRLARLTSGDLAAKIGHGVTSSQVGQVRRWLGMENPEPRRAPQRSERFAETIRQLEGLCMGLSTMIDSRPTSQRETVERCVKTIESCVEELKHLDREEAR